MSDSETDGGDIVLEPSAPTWSVLYRRGDGSFVINRNGMPYHVTEDDPLFAAVAAAAEGVTLGPEPAIVDGGPVADAVPQSISDRQFFQQLAVDGIITQDQALASNAAVIPPPLLTIIEAMPAEQQFAAKMLVSGATVFERNHPMTLAIAAARAMTSEQVDDFFRAAAAL